jgi:DNA invertase Pin-like site-specific DNA recombinase
VRCAIYTRKSVRKKKKAKASAEDHDHEGRVALAGDDDEDDGDPFTTCDAQRDLCARHCAALGWAVLPTRYDDHGFSGASLKRPALQQLLAAVAAGDADRIVVYRIDRWTRSLADYFRLSEQLDAGGVVLASLSERIDTTSAQGRFQLGLFLLMAAYERELAGERTSARASAAKARGLRVGTIPFGFRVAADTVSLEQDPDEQKAIKLMVKLDAKGRGARAICSELRRRGLRPRGTGWHATTVSRVLSKAKAKHDDAPSESET